MNGSHPYPPIHRPLSMAKEGQRYCLRKVGGSAETKNHLASLGFVPGAELAVLHRTASGSFVVSIRESRLALGQETAGCLWVS